VNKLKSITFFIDRCLGNRSIADILRERGLTVETHDAHFPQNARDVEWMPVVGANNWIILTKDANIGKNTLERIAVASANIRMFVLASQNLTGEEMANIFLAAIVKMQIFARKNCAPFIAKFHRGRRIEMWKDFQELLEELEKYSEL
jgi:predicted nuclease of predicted toxin-antitoxin system